MKKISFLAAALLVLSACSAQTYYVNPVPVNQEPSVPSKQKSDHFFISGIGQEAETNAAEICGGADKVIKVTSQMSFLNGFVGFLSSGLYTPRVSKIYCKD
jgi:uncharacterized lipoprotein YajG